ncbi:AbrB/MazE/SpoVT family DNA-binding domain-containing protein [Williamsia sp. CHRR-6]|uniref:AbrB/MazE/SpoVT family DNA-binding domain-containing protein n=1 Tax=Williamsia sp. CHRR-6 TaxID=2835871 RepID=UPI001BDA7D42|nr:AbrB/MazE/SpoVT family DNA-binding domain-containing protein [Williamsia sp. CHRR-6]MBT0565833.1 AbrB/MazE/SpoVT family DNA-binding domain-containing protein [Williamsia sp. CHRR-6]
MLRRKKCISAAMHGTTTVGRQGRIVIPAELRSDLGLGEGDVVHVALEGRRIVIEPPRDAGAGLRGILLASSDGRSLVEELLAERAAEAARDSE